MKCELKYIKHDWCEYTKDLLLNNPIKFIIGWFVTVCIFSLIESFLNVNVMWPILAVLIPTAMIISWSKAVDYCKNISNDNN